MGLDELKNCTSDYIANAVGNEPRRKRKTKYQILDEKRKVMMKKLDKGLISLDIYQKAIGALSMRLDQRITSVLIFSNDYMDEEYIDVDEAWSRCLFRRKV